MDTTSTVATSLRPRLLALAYRMLGSVTDAEDAVQDAFLRYQQEASRVRTPEAWLVRTTTRLCIDRLRQARRRMSYIGPWLPEPVAASWDGAAGDRLELAESLSMAFLVLLETLSPAERAAFLLREVFGYEFNEIGALLDKSPVNVRQLTARARKRLDIKERRFTPTTQTADELARRFFTACQSGDVAAVEALLTADVVYQSDGGGKVRAAPRPVTGTHRVANLLSVVFRKRLRACTLTLTTVNGQVGAVFSNQGVPVQIYTVAATAGAIDKIYTVLNPEKLRPWSAARAAEHATADKPQVEIDTWNNA